MVLNSCYFWKSFQVREVVWCCPCRILIARAVMLQFLLEWKNSCLLIQNKFLPNKYMSPALAILVYTPKLMVCAGCLLHSCSGFLAFLCLSGMCSLLWRSRQWLLLLGRAEEAALGSVGMLHWEIIPEPHGSGSMIEVTGRRESNQ